MKSLTILLLFVCICFGQSVITTEQHTFKNGYDPLYNQMITGSIPAYLAMMEARIIAAQRDEEIYNASKKEITPEMMGNSGVESTTTGTASTSAGDVQNNEGNNEPNSGDIQVPSGSTTNEKSGESAPLPTGTATNTPSGLTNNTPSGLTNNTPSGLTNNTPSGLTTTAQSGLTTNQPKGDNTVLSGSDELPSGLNDSPFADPSAVLINNYYVSQGVYDLPFGGHEYGNGYSDLADYYGAGDLGDYSIESAPFRVVNDSTLTGIKNANNDMLSLNEILAKESAQKQVLSATNPDDEKYIRELVYTKAKPDQAVVDKLQRQQRAALQVADPYEISVLHKLNEKMQRFGQQPQLSSDSADHVAVLKGLVDGIRTLRRNTEQQYYP